MEREDRCVQLPQNQERADARLAAGAMRHMLIGPVIGQGERPLPNACRRRRICSRRVSVPHLPSESIRLIELADVSSMNRVDLSASTGRYKPHQAWNWKQMDFKRLLKICCVAALVAFLFVGLGPSAWGSHDRESDGRSTTLPATSFSR